MDSELVRRQLASDIGSARALIVANQVQVNGSFAQRPSRLVSRGDTIQLVPEAPEFVSRGGVKLARALDVFGVDPLGQRCLDAGAATGGFTDCLLQRGAVEVLAVDVGYGRLHESLVANNAVVNFERTNIRHLSADDIGGPVDLVVGDLSFISLRTVLFSLVGFCRAEFATLVLLVKPQFEANHVEVSQGNGVIRDARVWVRVIREITVAAGEFGLDLLGLVESPLRGKAGNVEFLVHLSNCHSTAVVDIEAIVSAVAPESY